MKRDPRKNPMVGDRLKDRNGQVHVFMPLGLNETHDLDKWRKDMADAEVLEPTEWQRDYHAK